MSLYSSVEGRRTQLLKHLYAALSHKKLYLDKTILPPNKEHSVQPFWFCLFNLGFFSRFLQFVFIFNFPISILLKLMESETQPLHSLYSTTFNFLLWYSSCISNHKHKFPCTEIRRSVLIDLNGNTRRSYISQMFLRSTRSNSPSSYSWLRLRENAAGIYHTSQNLSMKLRRKQFMCDCVRSLEKKKHLLLIFELKKPKPKQNKRQLQLPGLGSFISDDVCMLGKMRKCSSGVKAIFYRPDRGGFCFP